MTKPDEAQNLVSLFFRQAAVKQGAPFLWNKQGGDWCAMSWREAAGQVTALSQSLKGLGVMAGDRVILLSESRPEWPIADLGIMAAGAISVPAYTTNSVHDHLHIITDSGAKGIIVSTAALAERVLAAAADAGTISFVISMAEISAGDARGQAVRTWRESVKGTADPVDAEAIDGDGTACIIYTSGTGGAPKGVMLSHTAILSNCRGSAHLLAGIGLGDEVFLSFLPLSHSYEHTAGQFFPIMIGAQIYYAEGMDKLAQNMREVKPTIMTAVPRLYEVMHGRIRHGVKQAGGRAEALFEKTVELGRKRHEAPASLSLWEKCLDGLLTLLIRRKVAARFGGRLKVLVSGGAPLNYDIGIFFAALGVRLLQGYGLTESAPVISCNPPELYKIDAVGPPLKGVEVRIADDGEILVRGELLMQGYWNNPEATAEAIQDGWLHTGDIGEFDGDGYLRITDRKKDLIVNSGGDNLSPQRVEGFLTAQPEIAQAMVHGDHRSHLVALIVPDPDFAASWAEGAGMKNVDIEALAEDKNFHAAISAAVDRVNEGASVIEKIRRFILADAPFTIENTMMTPTLKIRRHVIREKYGNALESLYGK
jgi:long-chain acyl-CoA synthetase